MTENTTADPGGDAEEPRAPRESSAALPQTDSADATMPATEPADGLPDDSTERSRPWWRRAAAVWGLAAVVATGGGAYGVVTLDAWTHKWQDDAATLEGRASALGTAIVDARSETEQWVLVEALAADQVAPATELAALVDGEAAQFQSSNEALRDAIEALITCADDRKTVTNSYYSGSSSSKNATRSAVTQQCNAAWNDFREASRD